MSTECDKCGEHPADCQCQQDEESKSHYLDYCGFTTRSCNALANNNIHTLEDLQNTSLQQLLNMDSIGKKTIKEIRKNLAMFNMCLKDETMDPDLKMAMMVDIPQALKKIQNTLSECESQLRYLRHRIDGLHG